MASNHANPPSSPLPTHTKRPQLTTAPLVDALGLAADDVVPPAKSITPAASAASSSDNTIHPDLTLPVTLSHAIDFLITSISHLPPDTLATLRNAISTHLTPKLSPTWDANRPSHGSAIRSLIALPGKLPPPLLAAAREAGVDERRWADGISETGEWEMWIDPGSVCWRDGGWMWCEEGFEWRTYKQTLHTVWQTPLTLSTPLTTTTSSRSTNLNPPNTLPTRSTSTPTNTTPSSVTIPPRQSHAIPIRAPAVFRIPPTPLPPTVEFGGLSLGPGGKEAREQLVGEMMACPPSPSAFRRTLPGSSVASPPKTKDGNAGFPSIASSLGSGKKLLPAVEINGLVAKKPAAAARANPWQSSSAVTSAEASAVPTDGQDTRRQRSSSPTSSTISTTAGKSAEGAASDAPPSQGLFNGVTARSVSGSTASENGSVDSGVAIKPTRKSHDDKAPQTPADSTIGTTAASSGKTVTADSGTTTPVAAGTGAVRGRAPGPGATGLAVSVQPYDGGNVGVLGGGVKLGGAGAIKTGPQGTTYKLKTATPGSAPPGTGSRRPAQHGVGTDSRGTSPAGVYGAVGGGDDTGSGGEGSAFSQATGQRGTATSPARPVKRRRGKPQARPWQPKSHTSFVGAMGLGGGVMPPGTPLAGPIVPNGAVFPLTHVRGISVPSGFPTGNGLISPPLPLPQPNMASSAAIWGSPSPPIISQGPSPAFGFGFGSAPAHHPALGASSAAARLGAASPGWNLAPPFAPSSRTS